MRIKRYCMVCLSLILVVVLSIFPAFASVYEVDPDTEVLDQPEIYYTDNYYPGMFADGLSTFAVSSYGSYSAFNWKPLVFYTYSVSSGSDSGFLQFANSTPSVTSALKMVSAEISKSTSIPIDTAVFSLGLDNTYFDFQSSDFMSSFTQQAAQADTLYIDGTFRFTFSSYWEIFTGSTSYRYAAVDPVAVQLLVDGKPYGSVFNVTDYTSPYTAVLSSATPNAATVTFDNVKVYGISGTPELIGFRVYVDTNYSNSYSLGSSDGLLLTNTNSLSWTQQPTFDYVRETTSSDQDLSNLGQILQNGLFNGNGVPFLDVVGSFLQDGLFDSSSDRSWLSRIFGSLVDTNSTGMSWLSRIFNTLSVSNSNVSWLDSNGGQFTTASRLDLWNILRISFLGLSSNLSDIEAALKHSTDGSWLGLIRNALSFHDSNLPLLNFNGNSVTLGERVELVHLVRRGLLGLSQNIKDFNSYLEDSTFSWQNYNLDTHQLDPSYPITGQNRFMNTAFQSIEENLGRLAYVFASDDEIDLRDQADPGVASFKESFGGGAKGKDIVQMKNTFDDVETMFDTGFSIDDFFDSLNSDSSWLSWFSAETAYSLDSTTTLLTVGDEDPFNHHVYQDHLSQLAELRGRGEAEK